MMQKNLDIKKYKIRISLYFLANPDQKELKLRAIYEIADKPKR